MGRAAQVRQVQLTRALKAAKAAGFNPTAYSIGADGTIHVSFGGDSGTTNSFDGLMGPSR